MLLLNFSPHLHSLSLFLQLQCALSCCALHETELVLPLGKAQLLSF